MNTKKRAKKLVITAGILGLMMLAPVHNNPLGEFMGTMTNTIEAQAAEKLPYSENWETQSDGSWKYKLNSGGYASGWIQDEVDKNWYYMDSNKVMLSGLVKSNDNKYYLLSEEHDGHFGHMITDGAAYKGIVIRAEKSGDYAGALSSETIAALRTIGLVVDNATDVSGSQHVTGGEVVSGNTNNSEMVGATFGEPTKAEEKSETTVKNQDSNNNSNFPANPEQGSFSNDGKYIYMGREWISVDNFESSGTGGSGGGSSWLSY